MIKSIMTALCLALLLAGCAQMLSSGAGRGPIAGDTSGGPPGKTVGPSN
jgi:hypothetical protein